MSDFNLENQLDEKTKELILSSFTGYMQTDGYAGYNKVENIKRLYCLAHIRRKFHEIIVNLDEEALKSLICSPYSRQLK